MPGNNNNNLHARLLKDVVYGVNHDLFADELGQSLMRAWSVGACDEQLGGMIGERIRHHQVAQLFGQGNPFRIPRLSRGNLILGKAMNESMIHIAKDWLRAGFLIVGNTGSGKTVYLCFLFVQIASGGSNIWVSDMYKTQLRHLRPILREMGQDLIILRPCDWKWNLLQSDARNPQVHLNWSIDLLVRLLGLPPRAASILRQAGHDLYTRFSVWEGSPSGWPNLYDLFEWVRGTGGLNAAARESILDKLGAMLVSLGPKCAAYRKAWSATDLARHSIVYEMRGASENIKQLLLESQMFSIFQSEIERGVVNGPLSLVIAFEDAQRFFCSGQQDGGEIAPMDELAGVIRGSGIGMMIIVQTMQGLSRRLIPNLATKVMGRLGSHEDYERLGADLAMDASQIDWARRHLRPGTFITQVSEGAWREPFISLAPYFKIPPVVDDAEAATSVKALSHLPVDLATEYDHWQPYHVINATETCKPDPGLSEAERRFLELVVNDPGKPSSNYAKAAQLNGKRAAEVRGKLIAKGLLREHEIATNHRGRNALVLEPLEAAYEAIKQETA